MITNTKIKKIIKDCEKLNHKITVRDISYVLLSRIFEDGNIAYKSIYGNDIDFNIELWPIYDTSASIQFLKQYLEVENENENKKKKKASLDISFEENKEYMLKLKKQTEEAMANKEIEKRDGLKILTDISVKLNDKFNVAETTREQVVIVQNKYNDICPICGTEISRREMTKEEAMTKFNLIEK